MGMKTDISWFTPQSLDFTGSSWRSAGYTEVSLQIFNALLKKDQKVLWNSTGTKAHVNYCIPLYYQFPSAKVIGYTPWEFTVIPPAWIDNLNKCDQIWTTSSWCADAYKACNLDPQIRVVPHGISDEWAIEEREIGDKFYFLHVGGDLPRKNVRMVIKAFLELYEGDKDYHLILKATDAISNLKLDPSFDEVKNHPQITIITQFLSEDDLISLYHHSHCMLYPTQGEGFGLIPFQAIATGMPTICTNLTGCTEYADLSMPLRAEFGQASALDIDEQGLPYDEEILLAVPDYNHLLELMKETTDNYLSVKGKAMRGARYLHQFQSWDFVTDRILDFLEL